MPHLDSGQVLQHRFMLCKTDVYHIPPVANGSSGKRFRESPEFLQIGNLPNYVITQTNGIQNFIHLRKPTGDLIECCHYARLLTKKQDSEA